MPSPTILPFDAASLAQGAAVIADGGIVAVATETVYGLAADARDADAVARIYAAKGRPAVNPLIVHVPDLAAAERLAAFDDPARALAAAFWPGPLTLVVPLRADAGLAPAVSAGLATVAVRVPAHPAMRALLDTTGAPLAAPSANRSGAVSPTTAAHVAASLAGVDLLILDAGPCPAGIESTIVMAGRVLRPGPIGIDAIDALLHPGGDRDPVAMRFDAGPRPSPGWKPSAPGQLQGHYAPAKPLRLEATGATRDEWLIGFDAVAGDDTLSASGDLTEAARRLFAALHRADASLQPRIAVAPVPTAGIGAAINDRLRRATQH